MTMRMDRPGPGGRALLLLPLLVLACGDGSDSSTGPPVPVPTRIEILTKDPVVQVGAQLTLGARVLDQNGVSMTGSAIHWSSEDLSTAVIDAVTGVASGVAGGEVTIVASAGSLSADAQLLVTYVVDPGQAMLRLRAGTDSTYDVNTFVAVFADRLGTEAGDYLSLVAFAEQEALAFFLPGRPQTEKVTLSSVDVQALWEADDLSGFNSPFLIFEKAIDPAHEIIFISRDGWLLPDRVDFPVGPGERPGQIRARTMATLDAWAVTIDAAGQPVFTQIAGGASLYADLWSAFQHVTVPVVSVSLTGGPYPGVQAVEDAAFRAFGDGRGVLQIGLTDGEQTVAYMEVFVNRDPAVGVWPISAVDPEHSLGGDYWAGMEFWNDPAYWLSESGELRIDAVVAPPASDLTGELKGAVTVSFGGWLPEGPTTQSSTGQHMAASVSFHVPWLDALAGATGRSALPRMTPIISRLLEKSGAASRPDPDNR